jgi:pyrroloquinoline-quinone synthase
MQAGRLTRDELRVWVLNRYYYQTRIPMKDALIVSKAEDAAFRRMWLRRIRDQDGERAGEGGLEQWQRLAELVGIERGELNSFRSVLPGARRVCDAYVELVRERTLVEAVAASLTELFAPDLMQRRILAWQRHYPWIEKKALAYFETRVSRAGHDAEQALAYVLDHARSRAQQECCFEALVRKTEILWGLLDAIQEATRRPAEAPCNA